MRFHEDHRRAFWGDIFEFPGGDINVVKLNPNAVIAWHRHQRQEDRIFCIEGDVLVQTIESDGKCRRWYLSAPDDRTVTIPRNAWHGYSTPHGAILLQFNGPGKWSGEDEERKSLDEMPWA